MSAETAVDRLREELAAERGRVEAMNRELGYALLTVGRLRGRLRQAGIELDGYFSGLDLTGIEQDGDAEREA